MWSHLFVAITLKSTLTLISSTYYMGLIDLSENYWICLIHNNSANECSFIYAGKNIKDICSAQCE